MEHDPRTTDSTISEPQQKWVVPTQLRLSRSNQFRSHYEKRCFPPEDEFLLDWGDAVVEYTRRSMTYHKDKLIAIKGIADAN
ncbi:hypothetical protein G3M48_000501 [Beauveria asiatica]|uniref:Uncharacterized protein n=1 Tax=Beauveria asiatica TaxID=1069075 RepID=A0AAW0S8N5_9HYPO